jgi:hypothetical protein
MGFFDFLMRQIAGRAEARADLVNVGAMGTVRDLPDLLSLLPPRDSFGEAAGEAALRILSRATGEELAAYADAAPRWEHVQAADIEASRDPGTLALAAFHPDPRVRAGALARLERTEGALAESIVAIVRSRE